MSEAPKVYAAIAAVQADLAHDGIGKGRKNEQQGYKFRGIDDVYNALAPILARHKLCMLPRMLAREITERTNAKGTALFYVVVEAEFDLVSAEDASRHTIRTYGEAMDSGDKATNKAMSAAYKYAAMQAFAIPTEGDNDADATTHEVAARHPHPRQPQPRAKMTDGELADHRAAFEAATSLAELSQRFATAYKAAAGDEAALDLLTRAKDSKKAILAQAPA